MGSKARYANELVQIITQHAPGRTHWIEPFVGGANLIEKVPPTFNRIGNDANKYVIKMFQALQNNWTPPDTIDESEYQFYRSLSIDIDNKWFDGSLAPLIGFVGIGCSYSGKWFGGYARGDDKNGNPRNYCLESKRNVLKQLPHIQTVKFISKDYKDLFIPDNSILYCDPPYQNATKYEIPFSYDEFWDWCAVQSQHNAVFVSEYNAPSDWVCLWSRDVHSSLTKDTGSKRATEKLFTRSNNGQA
jgi:DNA adenine methylase